MRLCRSATSARIGAAVNTSVKKEHKVKETNCRGQKKDMVHMHHLQEAEGPTECRIPDVHDVSGMRSVVNPVGNFVI